MALFDAAEMANLQALMRDTFDTVYQWESPGTGYGADAGWATVSDFVAGRRKAPPSGSVLPVGDGQTTPAEQWTIYLDSGTLPTPGDRLTDVDTNQRFRVIGVGAVAGGPMSRLQCESLHA